MADESSVQQGGEDETLFTLSDVSRETGISMPTLQRYKKNYQDRIPSVGEGRRQRYPREALEVFEEIKRENIGRRGRPRKSSSGAGGGGRKKAKSGGARKSSGDGDLLTLTRIGELTGISYPTLVRYVKLHGDQIPHEGEGRSRRYHPEAVEVFKRLRRESPRGRRAGSGGGGKARSTGSRSSGSGDTSGLANSLRALERTQASLEKQIREVLKHLKKPLKVTIDRR